MMSEEASTSSSKVEPTEDTVPRGIQETGATADIQEPTNVTTTDGHVASKKKKKKKKKQNKGESAASSESQAQAASSISMKKIQELSNQMELLNRSSSSVKSIEAAKKKNFDFWDSQPVPKFDQAVESSVNKAIEPAKDVVRQDSYSLPPSFRWDTLDIEDPAQLEELYTLLANNYVEDDDNMFRFDYSKEFLLWALTPPGWLSKWHCAVRVTGNNKLVGFISAVPANIHIYDVHKTMVEINFLCVHKKLRNKRVAPVLIREITRRVNVENIFQAVFTAGIVLPKPVATCRYWHRSLNPKKLVDVKFSHIGRNMTMSRTIKLYKLPNQTKTPGLRVYEPKDAADCLKVFTDYMKKFDLYPSFTEEEFQHWFTPREGIINTYVVEGDKKQVTDFISYYTLSSSIMHHTVHDILKAAYSFYNVSTTVPMMQLMQDAMILAKNQGFDVFNALDLMDNRDFLEELKFGIGDGNLQYYLYNWICPEMRPQQVGLVLQ
ncbi:glycylpeptide N-tetradecanoyltransferase 2-like [Anneissia japonica]|uniref:glycylpeptide N-tetradecanoyltransferase 2-like n=1 Tax=Anneissia japonica TaxID=1529436 RepID=UPI00142582C0|nr:glycylpeptide N-tetradecanoyltransferase 2-like [Anneissia japonica]